MPMKSAALASFSLALALAACNAAPPPAKQEAAQPAAPVFMADARGIAIYDGWAAATPSGASVAAGYLSITNSGDTPDRLIAASSPRAPRVEIHEMKMDGGMMQMRKVDGVDVPAHGAASLAPGGYHLMFMDIPAQFAVGEEAPVTLTFEHAGNIEITLPVRAREASHSGMEGMGDEH